ncbi:MAG: hypothetical protein R2776_06800 [Flavobacteriaceae bacterium]|nr:hypothetical protein [Flavobacteriaceae bacterium]
MTKTELFLVLTKPNKNSFYRWVYNTKFIEDYKNLQLGNVGSWCRASSSLTKKFYPQDNN